MEWIYLIAGLVLGAIVAYIAGRMILLKSAEKKAQLLIEKAEVEAENIKKEKLIQAKEKFLQMKEAHEKSVLEKDKKLSEREIKIKEKEKEISQKIEEVNKKSKQLEELESKLQLHLEAVQMQKEELEALHKKQVEQLEIISGMKAEDARNQLIEALKAEAKTKAMSQIQEIVEEAKLTANKEAKRIVIQTIQRVATEAAIENSVSVFNLESDELKGRIIGREGRNIRALEAATGVEIIVDDTPEAIIISCFDPVRREVARLALHQLVADGRIHPARIEEVVAKVQKQLEEEIIETGKRACIAGFGSHYSFDSQKNCFYTPKATSPKKDCFCAIDCHIAGLIFHRIHIFTTKQKGP